MSDLEALAAKVAELEQRLAAAAPPPAPEVLPVVVRAPFVYTPPATKTLGILAAELRPLNVREVRQLACAVALCRGEPLPGAEVPSSYEPLMRRLAALRAAGRSWRAALTEVGLEVPDDGEIAFQARQLRDGLTSMWDDVAALLSKLEVKLPNYLFPQLTQTLRPLL